MTAAWLGRGSIAHAAVKIQCSLTNFLINNQILSYPRISGYPKHSILYPKGVISYDRIASLGMYIHITKGFFSIWLNCIGSAAGPCLSGWLGVILKILVLWENHGICGHVIFSIPVLQRSL